MSPPKWPILFSFLCVLIAPTTVPVLHAAPGWRRITPGGALPLPRASATGVYNPANDTLVKPPVEVSNEERSESSCVERETEHSWQTGKSSSWSASPTRY
jgi:hypothetical protein